MNPASPMLLPDRSSCARIAKDGAVRASALPAQSLRAAFSLIEVLIAVTLMSVIILGLMATFNQTQRAFRSGIAQVDVMESGRAALEMMSREVEQARATRMVNGVNFYVGTNTQFSLAQDLPQSAAQRVNFLHSILFTSRERQSWSGIGYSVLYNGYIGTLYRFETNAPVTAPNDVRVLTQRVLSARPSRVVDNVVSLKVACYDTYGRLISPAYNYLPQYLPAMPTLPPDQVQVGMGRWGAEDIGCTFMDRALPGYVEIELGILESKTAERARYLAGEPQRQYLARQAGRVQVFRQRIPIRNVDPSVYQ